MKKVSRIWINTSDVYSSDVAKQKQVTEAYIQLLEIRDRLLNGLPVANTGPVR